MNPMNSASQWRYESVQPLAQVFAANPHVEAVLLGGSTARGHADRYSDIEVGVFWRQDPSEAERKEAAEQINGDLLRLYPYEAAEEAWCDDYMLGRRQPDQPKSGVLVEVVHYRTETLERTFEEVLERYDADPLKQTLIAAVVDGMALHNAALIAAWKERAAAYPDGLRLAVVNRYGIIDHFWRWSMWLARANNLMMLYQTWAQYQQQVLHMLLGLNKVYYFGFKWLEVIAGRLTWKPERLVERLAGVYQVKPEQGAKQLAVLVEETFDLIERHVPEADVSRFRTIFRYQRPQWEAAPPHQAMNDSD
jgi:predicted nucleotidyltransferase